MIIDDVLGRKLQRLGLIPDSSNEYDTRRDNVGESNYHHHVIQPWTIWMDYPELDAWDKDIIKRVLRTKKEANMTPTEARALDYKKIIHICNEKLRQLEYEKEEIELPY